MAQRSSDPRQPAAAARGAGLGLPLPRHAVAAQTGRLPERVIHRPGFGAADDRDPPWQQEHRHPVSVAGSQRGVRIDVENDQAYPVAARRPPRQPPQSEAQGAVLPGIEHRRAPVRRLRRHATLPLSRSRRPRWSAASPAPAPTASLITSVTSAKRFGTNFWWISSLMAYPRQSRNANSRVRLGMDRFRPLFRARAMSTATPRYSLERSM